MLQVRAVGTESSRWSGLEGEDPPSPERLQKSSAKGRHGHLVGREVERGSRGPPSAMGPPVKDKAMPLPRCPSQPRGRGEDEAYTDTGPG